MGRKKSTLNIISLVDPAKWRGRLTANFRELEHNTTEGRHVRKFVRSWKCGSTFLVVHVNLFEGTSMEMKVVMAREVEKWNGGYATILALRTR